MLFCGLSYLIRRLSICNAMGSNLCILHLKRSSGLSERDRQSCVGLDRVSTLRYASPTPTLLYRSQSSTSQAQCRMQRCDPNMRLRPILCGRRTPRTFSRNLLEPVLGSFLAYLMQTEIKRVAFIGSPGLALIISTQARDSNPTIL